MDRDATSLRLAKCSCNPEVFPAVTGVAVGRVDGRVEDVD